MAKTIKIYGSSDDILVIDGDFSDELYPKADEDTPSYVACSDGSAFRVVYDGCWRVTQVTKGRAEISRVEADEMDRAGSRPTGEPWYSDVVTLTGEIDWVICGDGIATSQPLRSAR